MAICPSGSNQTSREIRIRASILRSVASQVCDLTDEAVILRNARIDELVLAPDPHSVFINEPECVHHFLTSEDRERFLNCG